MSRFAVHGQVLVLQINDRMRRQGLSIRGPGPDLQAVFAVAAGFLKALVRAIPDKLHMVLTDNRVRFIERQAMTCQD
jgi:hypothetical protein